MNARVILGLGLLLVGATPVAAEEVITPLGDRWYRVEIAPVTIPESGHTGRIIICLDDIPGGLDGTPTVNVKPVEAPKESVTRDVVGFFPLGGDEADDDVVGSMPYVTVILRGVPGSQHRVKVLIRGKQ
jgi:hypothetical protein